MKHIEICGPRKHRYRVADQGNIERVTVQGYPEKDADQQNTERISDRGNLMRIADHRNIEQDFSLKCSAWKSFVLVCIP